MNKPLFLTAVLCLILQFSSFAQSIKLNNEGDPGSAMLEVNSASKGILIPNVSLTGITDATTIASPAVSLLVYNTATVSDVEPGYYYNSGTPGSPVWSRLSTGTTSQIGTNTIDYLSKWNGTALVSSNVFDNGTNVGIGTPTPDFKLEVESSTDARARIYSPSNSYAGFLFDNSLKQYFIGVEAGGFGSPFIIYDNTANELRFSVSTTGNVGIGPLNATAKLDVNGNVKVAGLISGVSDPVSAQDAATKAYVDGEITSLPTITTYAIGDSAHGGIVFWVEETGQHGLVCAKSNQSSGIRWYAGTYGNTRAKGDGLYAGKANTSIIISSQVGIGDDGSTYAAQQCNDLQITEGGRTFGDWYLPSKYELNLMWKNLHRFGCTSTYPVNSNCPTARGGFSSGYYWSSTEHDSGDAWDQGFTSGSQDDDNKDYNFNVRAVRAF
jgi:hypothetical protein